MFPEGQEAWTEFRLTGYPKLFSVVSNSESRNKRIELKNPIEGVYTNTSIKRDFQIMNKKFAKTEKKAGYSLYRKPRKKKDAIVFFNLKTLI